MYNTGLVDLEINLAALYVLDSVADFHCNGSCLRVRIVEVVGIVVALRLTVAVSYGSVSLMTVLVEADTCLRIEEIEFLVDVQLLILVAAVFLSDKLIVDTVGLVFYTAVLQVCACRKWLPTTSMAA